MIKSGAFGQALRPGDEEPESSSFPVSFLDLQRSLPPYPLITSHKFLHHCVPGSSRIKVVKLPKLRCQRRRTQHREPPSSPAIPRRNSCNFTKTRFSRFFSIPFDPWSIIRRSKTCIEQS